ncbi:MAG: hypothetical protein CSA82_03570 [Actinobacteria bacterium]|nr:MAG: hypothetical protein CSA82_03570 [Actinomycetota bacterium]
MKMVYISELVKTLMHVRGPALTWYGNERVELSGPVVARWLTKMSNLLYLDLSDTLFGPADDSPSTLAIDLPHSWQATLWTIAAHLSGWNVSFDRTSPANVLVTASPFTPSGRLQATTRDILLHNMEPLAVQWDGECPLGTRDALAELMAHSDVLESDIDPQNVSAWASPADVDILASDASRILLPEELCTSFSPRLAPTLVELWSGKRSAIVIARPASKSEREEIARSEKTDFPPLS